MRTNLGAALLGTALLIAGAARAEETPPREIVTGADFRDICGAAGKALSNPPGEGSRAAARRCKDYMKNFFQLEAARPLVPNDQVMCINGSLKWQEIADTVLDWGSNRAEFDGQSADVLMRAAMRARHPCPGGT
ncbi:Rap1a/Tai family immunity protein [Zavarzinia compransoris]|uniref:Rap1a immunity protein domain-containing protein n=1 Tax=Zavarzinia compransoris TaxID=1264899 RepID=A0A317E319_9PROT|nr:Rap1a/Tai family immunity protein [Zavarzinia compransoris]PWR20570.1 hypothetical protein DKG75_11215 [Zavarzinia compransoris]TDP43784.1 hypothetical protein DES42_10940 [Zavarzinia compransoris]